ncbi:MAG: recombinase zinc beta ribbon domain-containing protein, partial [Nitrospiraceae bacterium]
LHGRPTNGHEPPYLLTGFTECKECKGSLFIKSRSHGTRRAFPYACTTHYQRGPESCSEPMLLPMELLDHAILETLEQDVLQPSILVKGIAKALRQLQTYDDDPETRREALKKDLSHIEIELSRLATAIATGGSMHALLSAVQDREERRIKIKQNWRHSTVYRSRSLTKHA